MFDLPIAALLARDAVARNAHRTLPLGRRAAQTRRSGPGVSGRPLQGQREGGDPPAAAGRPCAAET
jgi:hypothetical protein